MGTVLERYGSYVLVVDWSAPPAGRPAERVDLIDQFSEAEERLERFGITDGDQWARPPAFCTRPSTLTSARAPRSRHGPTSPGAALLRVLDGITDEYRHMT
ncbi:hypothetical protein ACIQRK_33835 [Streptomyces anulatus]|jgi:hypothetical protein|uniref:hypothetical protein n=1 Tax=Streptomyces anulatus TaxID=1892 RepID=UPI0038091C8A|nr:hypothetical protein OG575_38865 [Streptomyces anulatus]